MTWFATTALAAMALLHAAYYLIQIDPTTVATSFVGSIALIVLIENRLKTRENHV